MIFEISDFCLNYLNGKFFLSSRLIFSKKSIISYVFMGISLYITFLGILTYNLTYILLQMMMLFNIIIKIHHVIKPSIVSNVSIAWLRIFLEGYLSVFQTGIIVSIILYIIYKMSASRKISMGQKFIYAYSELLSEFITNIVCENNQKTVMFLIDFCISRLLIVIYFQLLYKYTTSFILILYVFGGSYFFIESLRLFKVFSIFHPSIFTIMHCFIFTYGFIIQHYLVHQQKKQTQKVILMHYLNTK